MGEGLRLLRALWKLLPHLPIDYPPDSGTGDGFPIDPSVSYLYNYRVVYEFRWNDHNAEHIATHGVDIDEAEYVVNHPENGFPRAEADGKYLVWGQTAVGRYLQVVYIFSPASVVYVIHARHLDEQEKRRLRRRRK